MGQRARADLAAADSALRTAAPHPGSGTALPRAPRRACATSGSSRAIPKASANVSRRPSGWPTRVPASLCRDDTFTFTFVASRWSASSQPADHLAAVPSRPSSMRTAPTATRSSTRAWEDDRARARAFLDDFVSGRVHSTACCPQTASSIDLHAVPQAAFVQPRSRDGSRATLAPPLCGTAGELPGRLGKA